MTNYARALTKSGASFGICTNSYYTHDCRPPRGFILDQLRQQLQRKEISVGDGIVKALPLVKDRVPDDIIMWLVNELQGYSNSIEFYQKDHIIHDELPVYRVVQGSLKILDPDGSLNDLDHPFASRGKYFLSAPVSWLEEFESLPGPHALADCPDLTSYLAKGLGNVVCEFSKPQLAQIIITIRQRVIAVLDKVAQGQKA
jgi:hypothetical protein